MLCNLTTHNANELRNSRVSQNNIRTVLILCNRLCKLSISTIHGQQVAQHAMLRNMIDREWAPLLAVHYPPSHSAAATISLLLFIIPPLTRNLVAKSKNTACTNLQIQRLGSYYCFNRMRPFDNDLGTIQSVLKALVVCPASRVCCTGQRAYRGLTVLLGRTGVWDRLQRYTPPEVSGSLRWYTYTEFM
jgi:hypothetical protein